MKLSELSVEKLSEKELHDLVIKNVYYGTLELEKERNMKTAIVVLGANSVSIKERMLSAIELLKKGYGSHIIVTDNFEPKIEDIDDGNFDISNVPEDKVHDVQTKMMYEIAEIFQISDKRMIYFSDDLKNVDKRVAEFDRYILVTLIQNVRRSVLRCMKCFPNKKFEGRATMRDFSEWNLDMEEAKYKYSKQIRNEAENLINYAKKGYIEDIDVDFIFE